MAGMNSRPVQARFAFPQPTQPTVKIDGAFWIDTSQPQRPTSVYSSETDEWEPLAINDYSQLENTPTATSVNEDFPQQGIIKLVEEDIVVDSSEETETLNKTAVFTPEIKTVIDYVEVEVFKIDRRGEAEINTLELSGVDNIQAFDPPSDPIAFDEDNPDIFNEIHNFDPAVIDSEGEIELDIDISVTSAAFSGGAEVGLILYGNIRGTTPHIHPLEVENAE